MTSFTHTDGRSLGLRDRVAAFFANISESLERRRVYIRTYNELQALTDRELADLGLHRSNISRIAAEAALERV